MAPAALAARLMRFGVPLAEGMTKRDRYALSFATLFVPLIVAVAALHVLFELGGPGFDTATRLWAPSLVYVVVAAMVILRAVRVREARGPWTVLAVGLSLYGLGNLLWVFWFEQMAEPPIPSLSDGLWLALYPCAYVGMAWIALTRAHRAPAGVWLDGIVAGMGVAAVGEAIVFRPILESATGGNLAVATSLAYPIADVVLAALALAFLALRGWRLDRTWALLGGGFLVLAIADCLYGLQVAAGSLASDGFANLFYMVGVALLALAAWQPHAEVAKPRLESWSMLVVPGAFIVIAMGLLASSYYLHQLDPLAFTLAMLTLVVGFVRTAVTFRDVRALAHTRQEALTDDLTGLANRRMFRRRLDEAIRVARVTNGKVALLTIDLDEFKELNDALGHHIGDQLLGEIGPRLKGMLRATDTLARLGGDEFALILSEPTDERSALSVSDRVLGEIGHPFAINDLALGVGASIGVALFPDHGGDAEELLRAADVAMYSAKRRRSGRELYAPERDRHSLDHLALVRALGEALKAGEIDVQFQPKADASNRRVVGVEALARWSSPVHGTVSPDVFVPLAEQAGLARELTRHVLARSLDQCRAWRAAGHDLTVAVNLTTSDLHDSALPEEIAAALAAAAAPPDALVLEITESSVLTNPEAIGNVLARIGEMGVGLSLDDFGTGYSSLTHLKTLPVGELKIDRSFVAQMQSDPADAVIVGSTIQLAHSLGMRVVAEGVEDQETWGRLAAFGCEMIQGYVLAPALPAPEFEQLLPQLARGARL